MPTEEEFRLYERMAGGTGDMEQDAHIARHLQRIVNVPEREIMSFVRTRDRDTVHKLRTVLKEMPRGRTMEPGGPRAATRAMPGFNVNSDATKAKTMNLASSAKSDYVNNFAGDGRTALKTHGAVFDGIVKNGFQPHLDKWRDTADESKVRVLADACRSLRNFTTSKGPPTCYMHMFPDYGSSNFRAPPERNNKQNMSAVPLGMIYNASCSEKAALKGRDKIWRDTLTAAYSREGEILSGAAFKNKPHWSLCTFPDVPGGSTDQCLSYQKITSRDWKSEGRSGWNDAVHSKVAGLKFGLTHVKRGETKLRLEGCAGDRGKRDPRRMSQSTPALSKST